MADGTPIIENVRYISPYRNYYPPQGSGIQAGVGVRVCGVAPDDTSLVVRLRLAPSLAKIGISPTDSENTRHAVYQPPFPLSATDSYMVDAKWVETGIDQDDIDWTTHTASAPVVGATADVIASRFDGVRTFSVKATIGSSGVSVGTRASVYGMSNGVELIMGQGEVQEGPVSLEIEEGKMVPPPFTVYVEAVCPIANSGAASFSAPFSVGPISVPIKYPVPVFAITTVAYVNGVLAVKWDFADVPDAPAPEATCIEILNPSGVVTRLDGGANSALIPIDLNSHSDLRLSVSPVLGCVTGAAVGLPDGINLITEAPTDISMKTDPVTNIGTINWTEVQGANSYVLEFTNGNTGGPIPAPPYILDVPPKPGEKLGVTIQAKRVEQGLEVIGPISDILLVPAEAGVPASVRFDGAELKISWEPVFAAGGYFVSVYELGNSTAQFTGTTTESSLIVESFEADASKTYDVYVQPIVNGNVALTAGKMAVFTSAFFTSKQPIGSALPYVYPATSLATLGNASSSPHGEVFTTYLPEIGAGAGALGQSAISEGPFTLTPQSEGNYPYTLSFAADGSQWTFSKQGIRPDLQMAYDSFLKKLEEKRQSEGVTGATPYGIALVQEVIGRLMPQTFDELLYYNFGFSTESRWSAAFVDLRAGMLLRATVSDYVLVNDSEPPPFVNGYAGATVMDFDIGGYTNSSGDWKTGFDGFLNALAAQGVISVDEPAKSGNAIRAGVAGAVELYYEQFQQPFYRLFVPGKVQSSNHSGSSKLAENFTIAAASDYTSMTAASDDPTQLPTAYFRGVSTLEVMIRIQLDGSEIVVPIGTSIGNLLEQAGMRFATNSTGLKSLRVFRSILPAITDPNPASSLGPELEVRLDWDGFSSYGSGNGLDALSMPLLAGDRVLTGRGA